MEGFRQRVAWGRAKEYIRRYHPKMITVAGNYGTAMTAQALQQVLGERHTIRIPDPSPVDEFDVPLSILGLQSAKERLTWMKLLIGSKTKELAEKEPDTIVVEVKPFKPGQVDFIAGQYKARIGIITGIGTAHLDYFQTTKMIAHEISSLLTQRNKPETLILNIDDPFATDIQKAGKVHTITYGESERADIRLVRANRIGTTKFAAEIQIRKVRHEVVFHHVSGKHLILHTLPALAAARALDMDIEEALQNISQVKAPKGYFAVHKQNGYILIDDSATALPETVEPGLRALASFSGKRKIAVIGSFENLGHQTQSVYQRIGEKAAEVSDILIVVGDEAKPLASAALKTKQADIHHFHSAADAGKWIGSYISAGDALYITGATSLGMKQIVERLI